MTSLCLLLAIQLKDALIARLPQFLAPPPRRPCIFLLPRSSPHPSNTPLPASNPANPTNATDRTATSSNPNLTSVHQELSILGTNLADIHNSQQGNLCKNNNDIFAKHRQQVNEEYISYEQKKEVILFSKV